MSTRDERPDDDGARPDSALPDSALPDSALPDSALPDSALPDSAMASGSDAGEPGEHLGPAELEPDERRLLEALERDVTDPHTDAAEDSVAAVRAAEDEGPLPSHGGQQDDGLSVIFDPPE
jgi:hypothetical protein